MFAFQGGLSGVSTFSSRQCRFKKTLVAALKRSASIDIPPTPTGTDAIGPGSQSQKRDERSAFSPQALVMLKLCARIARPHFCSLDRALPDCSPIQSSHDKHTSATNDRSSADVKSKGT
jgi:hypothetical protein